MTGAGAAALPRWRRRRWVLVGVVVTVVLTMVVVMAAVAARVGSAGVDDPVRVVRAYLEAVRAGEPDEALRAAGNPTSERADADSGFLVAASLAGDWEIGQVVHRYPGQDDDSAVVDATLRSATGISEQGRYRLTRQDGAWVIANPFAELTVLAAGPIDYLQLNGAVQARQEPDTRSGAITYLLFPGFYRAYPHLSGLLEPEGLELLVVTDPPAPLGWPLLALHEAGQDAVNQAIAEYVDACAARVEPAPDRCPFAVDTTSRVDEVYYRELDVEAWRVVAYPQVRMVQEGTQWLVAERRVGVIRATGSGEPLEGENAAAFEVDCYIDVSTLRLRFTRSGDVEVTGETASTTCWQGALSR